jgi:hypothetical protein
MGRQYPYFRYGTPVDTGLMILNMSPKTQSQKETQMAKKCFTVLVIATVLAGGVSAQSLLSAGAGGFIGGDSGGGIESSSTVFGMSSKTTFEMPYFGGGGFAFLDAKYAELSLGIYSGKGKFKMTNEGLGFTTSAENDVSRTNFNIGLLGKYPFGISEKISVFPLLGMDYAITLSAKDKDGEDIFANSDNKTSDLNALWFKFGGGADFSLVNKLYLRLEAMYGVRLANKFEKDLKESAEKNMIDSEVKTLPGHGVTVKLAVGYKL